MSHNRIVESIDAVRNVFRSLGCHAQHVTGAIWPLRDEERVVIKVHLNHEYYAAA